MQHLDFTKMSGAGNDFVVLDARDGIGAQILAGDPHAFVRDVCHRRFGVGADGVLAVDRATDARAADFRMRYFNADGGEAEMCGNGARCLGRFALDRGLGAGGRVRFETIAGPHAAERAGEEIRVAMLPPRALRRDVRVRADGRDVTGFSLDTGVPHYVAFVDDVSAVDVVTLGRALRRHESFAPAGTNVDFVQRTTAGLRVRTYERGVEDETLACGTGLTASAIAGALAFDLPAPVTLRAESGQDLRVGFTRDGETFRDVWLEGEARVVFTGAYAIRAEWLAPQEARHV
jgi:diaminopimelate epimerase